MNASLNNLYLLAGVSKQAFHQNVKREEMFNKRLSGLILEADILKQEHPGCGVEKMYLTLNPEWIGRDRFIDLFMSLGYRVKRIRNYTRTTISILH